MKKYFLCVYDKLNLSVISVFLVVLVSINAINLYVSLSVLIVVSVMDIIAQIIQDDDLKKRHIIWDIVAIVGLTGMMIFF